MNTTLSRLPAEQLSSFLAAVGADPDADGPRLVFADWLDDHGDPRAELIRTQCEMARAPYRSVPYLELEDRERDWLDRHHGQWPAGLDGEEVTWERGLPVVELPSHRLPARTGRGLHAALEQGWIDHLRVTVSSANEAERLAGLGPPTAGKVGVVRLTALAQPPALAHLRRLGRLRLLDLDGFGQGEDRLRALEGWADLAGTQLPTARTPDAAS